MFSGPASSDFLIFLNSFPAENEQDEEEELAKKKEPGV
jgi:hypothetical protein